LDKKISRKIMSPLGPRGPGLGPLGKKKSRELDLNNFSKLNINKTG
jgi:hypothetical protein